MTRVVHYKKVKIFLAEWELRRHIHSNVVLSDYTQPEYTVYKVIVLNDKNYNAFLSTYIPSTFKLISKKTITIPSMHGPWYKPSSYLELIYDAQSILSSD